MLSELELVRVSFCYAHTFMDCVRIGCVDRRRLPPITHTEELRLALEESTKYGHFRVVKLLVDYGVIPSDREVHAAATYGRFDILQYLETQGVNLHTHDDLAIKLAAFRGHLATVQFLYARVKRGRLDEIRLRCLEIAQMRRYHDIVHFLERNGN